MIQADSGAAFRVAIHLPAHGPMELFHHRGINKAHGRYGSVRTTNATTRALLREIQPEESSKNLMKIKTVQQLAISLLAGAALHGSASAGPATGTYRPEPVVSAAPGHKTAPHVRHTPIIKPNPGASQPAASRQFNAGEGAFSLGDDWFRD
jgi:hypothetical protein